MSHARIFALVLFMSGLITTPNGNLRPQTGLPPEPPSWKEGGQSGLIRLSEILVFPDPAREVRVIRRVEGKSGDLPVGKVLPDDDPLAAKILEELRLPYHHSVVRLAQCSRNLSGRKDGPNALFLSSEEGGFPRHGLAVREGGAVRPYPDLNYVDLVLDEKRVAAGELSIYSHELGHVMMMNVGPSLPERRTVLQHVGMGITDPSTAFNEGWGAHFQRLTIEAVPKYRQAFVDGFGRARGARTLWHSLVDEDLRVEGVLRNLFIWRKALPAADPMTVEPARRILLEHTSPLFDRTRLKNGNQMLACEGVLATLFYRIATSPALRENYAPAAFYRPFLLGDLPPGVSPRDVFSPFENVMLKSFRAWEGMKGAGGGERATDTAKPPFPAFVDAWARAVPSDREELLRILLETTAGRTADPGPGRLLEKAAPPALVGDYFAFRPALDEYEKALAGLTARVLSGEVDPGAALGPEIWVENPGVKVRRVLWSDEELNPLRLDLNTCSEWDLTTFPGIPPERARSIVAARDKAGFFRTIEEAKAAGFIPPAR